MKLNAINAMKGAPTQCGRTSPRSPAERGSAVIIVLALLAIMTVLTLGNAIVLRQLKQELRLIERRQEKRLELVAPVAAARGAKPATTPDGTGPPE